MMNIAISGFREFFRRNRKPHFWPCAAQRPHQELSFEGFIKMAGPVEVGGVNLQWQKQFLVLSCILGCFVFQSGSRAFGRPASLPPISLTAGLKLEVRLAGLKAIAPHNPRMVPVLGPGIFWNKVAGIVVATSNRGLVIWKQTDGSFTGPSLISNHLPPNLTSPLGFIRQKRSIGAAYFVPAARGVKAALVVDQYSGNVPRLTGHYRIALPNVPKAGVEMVSPPDTNWFATLPWIASPNDHIRFWSANNGSPLPTVMPPIWQAHSSMFWGRNGTELGWVSRGHYIRIARVGAHKDAVPKIRRVRVVAGPIERGAISPDGRNLLLLTGTKSALYALGSVTAVMVAHSRREAIYRYPNPAAVTASPVFSPNGRLAAFGLFAPYSSSNLARTLVFITSVPGFHILGRIAIPGIEPDSLRFSPGGNRLAVTASNAIFIFHVPLRMGKRIKPLWREMYRVQRIALPSSPIRRAHR